VNTALVTGAQGKVGSHVVERFQLDGWRVRAFDLKSGDDLRDEQAVDRAAKGCEMIVHAGAIAHDSAGTPADIAATNVLGTWHVLLAAERRQASRVVYFSSAQVFGFAEGEGTPDYLPVDDAHPVRAARPYGMSKRLAEEMCEAWTFRTAIPTVVLRPVMILDDDGLAHQRESNAELGAFVHVHDVVTATTLALTRPLSGHHRMILCGPGSFDTSRARQVLGWAPTRA
jgi:UDP-glucose 4-epimerase